MLQQIKSKNSNKSSNNKSSKGHNPDSKVLVTKGVDHRHQHRHQTQRLFLAHLHAPKKEVKETPDDNRVSNRKKKEKRNLHG